MRNLNKSNILTTIESINGTLKKNLRKLFWVHSVPSSIKVGSFFFAL